MYRKKLYGAVLGDLAGQPFEFGTSYKKPFQIHNPDSVFTDDTILTIASAESMITNIPIETLYRKYAAKYPECGFGSGFREWLKTSYGTKGNSYGNGCLMRMSPFMYSNEPLKLMFKSVNSSHDNEESYQSCLKLYNLYQGINPDQINKPVKFQSFTARSIHSIEFCKDVYYYTKNTYEAIEISVKMKGDTDTHASIVGELSNYKYQDLTKTDIEYVESKLDKELIKIIRKFNKYF